jgi:hypothetical protein
LPAPPAGCEAGWSGRFEGTGRLLLYQRIRPGRIGAQENAAIRLYSFEVGPKQLETTGSVPEYYGSRFWVSPSGARLLTRSGTARRVGVTLRDGLTGGVLKQLAEGLDGCLPGFLPDGRIVVVERTLAETSVHLFSPDGEALRSYPLGSDLSAVFASEPVPGSLLFMTKPIGDNYWTRSSSRLLDLATGTVTTLEGLRPAVFPWWSGDYRLGRYPSDGSGSLFLDEEGGLVRYDFATGQRTVIVQGRG